MENFILVISSKRLSEYSVITKPADGPDNLFVCFVALRPKSTAMVMAGRSVDLTTLFPGQAWTSS